MKSSLISIALAAAIGAAATPVHAETVDYR
jgi:hypothetical protein